MVNKVESLKTLHTRLIDSRDGFKNALDDVPNDDIGTFLRKCHEDRAAFHDRLHQALDKDGVDVAEGGSTAAAAHRTLMDLRGAVSSEGKGVYTEAARGEGYLKSAYDDAIDATEGDPTYDFLVEQRAKVVAAIEEANNLAA